MAAYRLAHELGYANVDAMLEEMSTTHIREWVAFLAHQDETARPKPEQKDGTVTHWRDMKGLLGTRVKTPQA